MAIGHRAQREPHLLYVTFRCSCGLRISAVRGLAELDAEAEMSDHIAASLMGPNTRLLGQT